MLIWGFNSNMEGLLGRVDFISEFRAPRGKTKTYSRHTLVVLLWGEQQVEGCAKAGSLSHQLGIEMSDKTCIALFDYKGEGGATGLSIRVFAPIFLCRERGGFLCEINTHTKQAARSTTAAAAVATRALSIARDPPLRFCCIGPKGSVVEMCGHPCAPG